MTPRISRSPIDWIFGAAVAIVGCFAVYKLPYFFPPKQRLVSSSYLFGFNNSIAVLAMAGLLGCVALYCLWRGRRALGEEKIAGGSESLIRFPDDSSLDATATKSRLSHWLFVVMSLFYGGLTLLLYWYSQRAGSLGLTWESRHFLHRIKLHELYHLRPYVDFQAEYGPALMYPPAWLHMLLAPLGVSMAGAYFLCHWLMNIAGLGCLFYLLRHIAGPVRARAIAFVVISLAGFGPWMGLNGVVLRYALPFASVLFAHRCLTPCGGHCAKQKWIRTFALVAVLMTANVLISPEIALAFTLGWIAYLVLVARRGGQFGIVIAASLVAMVLVGIVCRFTLPEAYYGSLLRFSQGANNLPILPAAHLLFYLVTLLIVVPPLLSAGWRGETSDAPLLGTLGALCVVMMPGALGRCDPPHVLFYGLVASMFLMVRFGNFSGLVFTLYTAGYAAVFIGLMWVVTLTVFFGVPRKQLVTNPPAALKELVRRIRRDCVPRDTSYLVALDKYPSLGLPCATYGSDDAVEAYLFDHHKVIPEFYVGSVGVYTEAEVARKLDDVSRQEFILVPEGSEKPWEYDVTEAHVKNIKHWFLYPARLTARQKSLESHDELIRYIASHFHVIEKVGHNFVMQRNDSTTTTQPTQPVIAN